MSKKIVKLNERREKKIGEVKLKKRKRLIIISAVVLALFGIAYLAYSFEIFNVTEIKVRGNINVSDTLIIENSGIKRNESLFKLNRFKVQKRVQKVNWVESAIVSKKWPSTVLIKVAERKPFAYFEINKEKFLLDKNGFVVDKQKNYKSSKKLIKINIFKKSKVVVGQKLSSKNVVNLLKAYLSLSKDIKGDVTNITSRSVDELYFVSKGIEIMYGKAEDTRLKNEVIRTLLKNKKEEYSTIDVRIADKPVVRLIGKQVEE